jgi:hypothetical protein
MRQHIETCHSDVGLREIEPDTYLIGYVVGLSRASTNASKNEVSNSITREFLRDLLRNLFNETRSKVCLDLCIQSSDQPVFIEAVFHGERVGNALLSLFRRRPVFKFLQKHLKNVQAQQFNNNLLAEP